MPKYFCWRRELVRDIVMEILCMGNFCLLGLFADQLLTSWKSEMSYLFKSPAGKSLSLLLLCGRGSIVCVPLIAVSRPPAETSGFRFPWCWFCSLCWDQTNQAEGWGRRLRGSANHHFLLCTGQKEIRKLWNMLKTASKAFQ